MGGGHGDDTLALAQSLEPVAFREVAHEGVHPPARRRHVPPYADVMSGIVAEYARRHPEPTLALADQEHCLGSAPVEGLM